MRYAKVTSPLEKVKLCPDSVICSLNEGGYCKMGRNIQEAEKIIDD